MRKDFSLLLLAILTATCLAGCQRGSPATPVEHVIQVEQQVTTQIVSAGVTVAESAEPSAGSLNQESQDEQDVLAPTPVLTIVPSPAPTTEPTPEPTPEPEPTPDPLIGISTSNSITITKQPGGETLWPGASAIFTAFADYAVEARWQFISPDLMRAIDWDADDIESFFPGLICTGGNSTVINLYSIPAELNGWYIACLFSDEEGNMLQSDGAQIFVSP